QVTFNKVECGTTGCFGFNDLGNAASSRSQGVELEGQWLPTKNLSLGTNITYLKAYYLSFPNGSRNTTQSYCATPVAFGGGAEAPYCVAQFPDGVPLVNNLTGQAVPYAPKWSGSLAIKYGISLAGDYKFTTELDPYFTTDYSTVSGDSIYRLPGYVRL